MKNKLRWSSSAFPGGYPGIGLLLLRAAIGATAVVEGVVYIGRHDAALLPWTVGLLAIGSGSLLMIGFMTKIACVLVGVTAVYLGLSSFPAPTPEVLAASRSTILVVVVAAALVCLGPGALSLDARRFGRREIIIPRTGPSGNAK